MKTHRFVPLFSAVLGVAAFSTAGCGQKDRGTAIVPPPPAMNSSSAGMAGDTARSTGSTATTASNASAGSAGATMVTPRWGDLERLTFDQRGQFMAGLKQMEVMIDRQKGELTAKRAAMPAAADTKNWDFAMKEMDDARTYLKSMGEEASKATAATWDQQRAKVGQAWVRAQAAYDKVKSSTTS